MQTTGNTGIVDVYFVWRILKCVAIVVCTLKHYCLKFITNPFELVLLNSLNKAVQVWKKDE